MSRKNNTTTLAILAIIVVAIVALVVVKGGYYNIAQPTPTTKGTATSSAPIASTTCPTGGTSLALSASFDNFALNPATLQGIATSYSIYTPASNNGKIALVSGTTSSSGSVVPNPDITNCNQAFTVFFGDNANYYLTTVYGKTSDNNTNYVSTTLLNYATPSVVSFQNASTTSAYSANAYFKGVSSGSTQEGSMQVIGGSGFYGNPNFAIVFAYPNVSTISSVNVQGASPISLGSLPSISNAQYAFAVAGLNYSQRVFENVQFKMGTMPANVLAIPVNVSVSLIPETNYNQNGQEIVGVYSNPTSRATIFPTLSYPNAFNFQ